MRAIHFFKHLLNTKTKYSVHSPFVFDFFTQVLEGKKSAIGADIETLRKKLCRSSLIVEYEDLGAGRGNNQPKLVQRSIGEIARNSARTRMEGEFLYRLCKHYQPQRCLELGTNLGISTLYQLRALGNSQFISLEGASVLFDMAQTHIHQFGLEADLRVGEFGELLDKLDLAQLSPDYVFIDGNHRYEATMEYFYRFLPHIAEGGLMIFDDIYWSAGMVKAWQEIIQQPEVSVSIDLFFFGLCFIRRKQQKEHFRFVLK